MNKMGIMRFIKVWDKNRTLIVSNRIVIPKGGSVKFTDYRGAVIAELGETGNLALKGEVSKK